MTDPVATLVIRPQSALDAYKSVDSDSNGTADGSSFSAVMQRALQGVEDTSNDAESKSMEAISGQGNITDVVMAVSKAELALQTTVALRDKMVSAYQTIMNMAI